MRERPRWQNNAVGHSDWYHTWDGVEITEGLRVWTNDWCWGTVINVEFKQTGLAFHGWYDVRLDNGRVNLYNGERMRTTEP